MLPASALPVIVGVVSFVVVDTVVSELGALGAVASIVIDNDEDSDEVLPAASVAVAVNEYVPSLRVDDVMENAPLLSAVPEPKRVVPLYSFTVLPASALPVIIGVASFVVVDTVVSELGALGAVVSIVIDNDEDEVDILPRESVAVAVNEYVPSLRVDDVMENAPLLSAVPEPKRVVPLYSFTVLPASALPVIIGVASFVVVDTVVSELGALGAVVSIVMDKADDSDDVLPAVSVAVAVSE